MWRTPPPPVILLKPSIKIQIINPMISMVARSEIMLKGFLKSDCAY